MLIDKKKLVFLIILVALVMGFFVYSQSSQSVSQATKHSILSLRSDDHFKGDPDALIDLFIYKDFQCPACAYFSTHVLKTAWPEIKDYVRVVYRHFPLTQIHRHARQAALYAESVAQLNQGNAFWKFTDRLYHYQDQWSKMLDPAVFFDKLLKSVGVEPLRVHELLDSEVVQSRVNRDLADANALNLQGTPSVFLNQTALKTFEPKELVEAVLEYHDLLKQPSK